MAKGNHPDRKKCMEYLEAYGTPSHVIGHCKSVAAVACRLGEALNNAGGTLAGSFSSIRMKEFTREYGRTAYVQDHSFDTCRTEPRLFDIELIRASGLLHDMARVEERHWDVCADWCRDMGYPEEEQIIRVHMMYQYTNDAAHLTEADLVSLGDRLSLEDHYAGLDLRMDYIIKKAERHGAPGAREAILQRKEETRKLLEAIEHRIGMTIDELMKDIDYEN